MLKTTIIMTACDSTALQRQITSATLGNISRYTDREEYELVLVDQADNRHADLNQRHHHIEIDKHIKIEPVGMSRAMNLGYKESSKHPYICFMHNDVFVQEGWLKTMREFVDRAGIVMPHQGPSPREQILQFYSEEDPKGNDDAGMVMMTRKLFEQTGGWDERFWNTFQDAAFRARFPVGYYCTGKCLITHIGSINMYSREDYAREDPIWMDLKNNGTGKDINYL